jgi:copper chaperone CopZ
MMKWTARTLAALVVFGLAGLPATAAAQTGTQPVGEVQPDTTRQVIIQVDGMSCPFCAYGLEKKLSKLDGVEQIEISLEQGQAVLTLEEGASVTDEALKKAVADAGFTLRKIERPGTSTG